METEIDKQTATERQLVPSRLSPTPLSPPTGQSALLLLLNLVSVVKRETETDMETEIDRQTDSDRETVGAITHLSYTAFSSGWTVSIATSPESGQCFKERDRDRHGDRDKQTATETDSWCHQASLLVRVLLQLDSQHCYSS